MGAPVGIGATFVKDYGLLNRAFTQGEANYLEGSFTNTDTLCSMDSLGIPYNDLGVELSAPSRGAVVWALIKEIGTKGFQLRVTRHNQMAKNLAQIVENHPNLELLIQPTLSICCFRYISEKVDDQNLLNQNIHRQLVRNGKNIPSTTIINNKVAIRPCFIGARASDKNVTELIEEVLFLGKNLISC